MQKVLRQLVHRARSTRDYLRLPEPARRECRRDGAGLPEEDPGPQHVIDEGIAWLGRAQDCSASRDGGVAHHYSLVTGWSASYPETTGYIIPTMLAQGEPESRTRARRMLEWLVSIQFPEGGFQGGPVDAEVKVPAVFDTGQILLGLAAGEQDFGGYLQPLRRAADWLVEMQDGDGCWRRPPNPFVAPGEKTYETHVAWGLLEAARVAPDSPYAEVALKNVRWALTHQRANGWFDCCCLEEPARPLTHTLGYVLRGLLEAYRFTGDGDLLAASRKTADGLLGAMDAGGFLAGRLDSNWRAAASWSCLTGTAQISICWLMLFEWTGESHYRDAAFAANRYVRRTIAVAGPPERRGGVKGSFPVNGGYGTLKYLNWACKFAVDANVLELAARAGRR